MFFVTSLYNHPSYVIFVTFHKHYVQLKIYKLMYLLVIIWEFVKWRLSWCDYPFFKFYMKYNRIIIRVWGLGVFISKALNASFVLGTSCLQRWPCLINTKRAEIRPAQRDEMQLIRRVPENQHLVQIYSFSPLP